MENEKKKDKPPTLHKWLGRLICCVSIFIIVVAVAFACYVFFGKQLLGKAENALPLLIAIIITILVILLAFIYLLRELVKISIEYECYKCSVEREQKKEEKQQKYMEKELYAGLLRYLAEKRFEKEEIKELLREFRTYVDREGEDQDAGEESK